jgi:dihydroorotase
MLAAKQDVDFWSAPFGLPGLDTMFPLMLDAALSGHTSLARLTATYAEAPARRLRLARRGYLAPGMDADMVVVDPHGSWVVSNDTVRSKAGWSLYDGPRARRQVVPRSFVVT